MYLLKCIELPLLYLVGFICIKYLLIAPCKNTGLRLDDIIISFCGDQFCFRDVSASVVCFVVLELINGYFTLGCLCCYGCYYLGLPCGSCFAKFLARPLLMEGASLLFRLSCGILFRIMSKTLLLLYNSSRV